MSASDKKRLRKEQNAAALTEKQLQAKKEAKKLKAYTISFVVVMVLVIAIVLGVVVTPLVAGVINRSTHAVTVGNHKLSTTDLTYFYVDEIRAYYSDFAETYGDYADLYAQMMGGVVSTKPLSEQVYDQETGKTWADYFIEEAKSSAVWAYAIYDEAMKDSDFALSEDSQKFLDNFEDNMAMYATFYGFSSLDSYLRNYYGEGANTKTYKEYSRVTTIASEYASEYLEALEFTDEDYRKYEEDKYQQFCSYSYSTYYIGASTYLSFLELGTETKDENGKTSTTYSDEDNAKALEAAKNDASALAVAENNTVEKLNAAIAALKINAEKEEKDLPKATEIDHLLYDNLSGNAEGQKWLSDPARKPGDITMIEHKTEDSEGKETVRGFYIILLEEVHENKMMLADVRHILVKFTGGKKNETTGETEYTQEEKDIAKEKAQQILDQFNDTDKTSTKFADLAKEKSEDTGSKSNGGLIEGIHPDAGYVETFTDWALEGHEVGDTGLVETPYGWHVMFYEGDGELCYRDYLIDNALTQEHFEAWEKSLTEKVTVTDANLNGMDRDFIIEG